MFNSGDQSSQSDNQGMGGQGGGYDSMQGGNQQGQQNDMGGGQGAMGSGVSGGYDGNSNNNSGGYGGNSSNNNNGSGGGYDGSSDNNNGGGGGGGYGQSAQGQGQQSQGQQGQQGQAAEKQDWLDKGLGAMGKKAGYNMVGGSEVYRGFDGSSRFGFGCVEQPAGGQRRRLHQQAGQAARWCGRFPSKQSAGLISFPRPKPSWSAVKPVYSRKSRLEEV